MNINFNNYNYNGAWYGKEKVNFNGKNIEIDVQIDGYDEDIIPENSKIVLHCFLDNFNNKIDKIVEATFEYYCSRKDELGYSDEESIDFPTLGTPNEILEMITLIGITIPDQDYYNEAAVSLIFNCTWDKENGMGICFVGEYIDEIGFQDVAL